jgi:predicted phosphodiesterase
MHCAIVSDLHGNLQGWQAVLADIRQRQPDLVVCLGDIIGYGPQPAETLASCRSECHAHVLGNHDAVVAGLLDMACFNEDAQRSTRWTVARIGDREGMFFKQVPLSLQADSLFFSHATVSDPAGFGYLDTAQDAAPEFAARPERLMFVGHTHHAKVFEFNETTGEVAEHPAEDFSMRQGCRYIVNPGSVGDPRTPEPLACYATCDTDSGVVRFHALDFDLDAYREAWRASKSPYQQYFHRCLDGDIPITAAGERIAPPPVLVARKVAAGVALVEGKIRKPGLAGPPLLGRNFPATGNITGGSPAGKTVVPAPADVRVNSGAGQLAGRRQFPWLLVVVLLFLGLFAWVGYLRFFTDAGFGLTRQAREAEALQDRREAEK